LPLDSRSDVRNGAGISAGRREFWKFSFFEKRMLVFSCDFENLLTISWMKETESVDSSVDSEILGLFHPDGAL
jgi:hypothetical protein